MNWVSVTTTALAGAAAALAYLPYPWAHTAAGAIAAGVAAMHLPRTVSTPSTVKAADTNPKGQQS